MPPAAKKFALLIGNDRYADFPDLKVPAADVTGLQRVLADSGAGGFGDNARVLMNPDLRPAQEAISELCARRTRDDLVLLYFSGHGETDGVRRGALHLALPESRRDRLRATAIPADFIKTELDECQAGRQVLILDCCYAGAIGEKGGALDPACFGALAKPSPAIDSEGECNGYGRVTLTSSTATQTSWEGNQVIAGIERSLFTHFLIQGLETGEAAEGRPRVSIAQLYRYAHARVVAATTAAGCKRMDPQYWVHRQQGELIIARNPHSPVLVPEPQDLLDADLLTDLACGNHRTRLGAVRELTELMGRPDLTAAVRRVLSDRLPAERDFQVRALIEEALRVPADGDGSAPRTPVGSAVRTNAVQTAAPAVDAMPGNRIGDTATNPPPPPQDAPPNPVPLFTSVPAGGDRSAQRTLREPVESAVRTDAPAPKRRRSWWWIVAAGVLALVFVGVLLSERLRWPATPKVAVSPPPPVEPVAAQPPVAAGTPAPVVPQATPDPTSVTPAAAPQAEQPQAPAVFQDRLKDGSPGPKMVIIPAGSFLMGSPDNEPERSKDEKQHPMEIKQPFAIGKYEVTVAQFRRFAEAGKGYRTEAERGDGCYGWKDGFWHKDKAFSWRKVGFKQGDDSPVVCVSWNDARAYTEWLSDQTGKTYRLPTEAEWEYTARAGTTTPFFTGDCISTEQANYNGTYDYNACGAKTGAYPAKTLAVGSFKPNAWGLYDLAGNVWEWTCSAYAASYDGKEQICISKNDAKNGPARVIRGGSWNFRPAGLRCAYRDRGAPSGRTDNLGFRLAQDL